MEKILPNVDGPQRDEEQIEGTVVAPARQVKDTRARKAISEGVKILGYLPGRLENARNAKANFGADQDAGEIVAVQQGNVFGTSFHPELTSDIRIHVWWLMQILEGQEWTLSK